MDKCNHSTYNWDLVYRCQGCGDIVDESMAGLHDDAQAQRIKELEELLMQLPAIINLITGTETGNYEVGVWDETIDEYLDKICKIIPNEALQQGEHNG